MPHARIDRTEKIRETTGRIATESAFTLVLKKMRKKEYVIKKSIKSSLIV